MPLPLIPIAIVGGASALGLGTYFGLSNQEPDVTNYETKKISNITNNTSKITKFDFGSATFESGSNLSLYDYLNNSNSNRVLQEDTFSQAQSSDNTFLYLALGVGAVGLYLYTRGKK